MSTLFLQASQSVAHAGHGQPRSWHTKCSLRLRAHHTSIPAEKSCRKSMNVARRSLLSASMSMGAEAASALPPDVSHSTPLANVAMTLHQTE